MGRRPSATCVTCLIAGLAWMMTASPVAAAEDLPAFSGAEGPGATASGGRGGDVYHVTTLEFDVSGTLRGSFQYGLKNAPAAGRTIVFDVGGTIYHPGGGTAKWFRADASRITVAGQTAPGGITIAGVGTKWTGDNVILRNITVRPNKDPVNPASYTYDGFSLQVKNSIVDHVSTSWYSDEGISITDAGHTSTVQYATIGEGLAYAGHAFGSIIATEVDGTHYSFNHNLYAHNSSRLPAIGSELGQTGAVLSFTNNVIYNWPRTKAGYSATDQHSSSNFIGNYYVTGYNSGVVVFSGGDGPASAGFTKLFQTKTDPALANKADFNKNGVIDGIVFGPGDKMPDNQSFYSGSTTFVGTPFSVTGAVAPDTADLALARVLAYSGANWRSRNPIDQRIVDSVSAGSGRIINDVAGGIQATEWATVMAQRPDAQGNAPFTRPAGFDSDSDGMPDAWEVKHGTNPVVANHNGDFDADGYTDLEEYLNELAAWPAPTTIVFTGSTSARYADIRNWDADPGPGTKRWQPAHFDIATITHGRVVVDAAGQHAGTLLVSAASGTAARLAMTSGWLDVADLLAIGPSGAVDVAGGSLTTRNLTVALTGTGSLTITGGLVAVTGTMSRGSGGGLVLVGGTLAIGAGGTTGTLATSIVNNGTLLFDRSGVVEHGRTIEGTGLLLKGGPGTLALTTANSFGGATSIRQGILRLDHADALAASVVATLAGGTLALAPGVHATLAGIDLTAGGVVDVGTGGVTVRRGLTPERLVAALVAGRGSGSGNGPGGIVSSATEPGSPRTVGWLDHGDGSISFAWAAPGDANLDGCIDVLDVAQLVSSGAYDSGGPTTWSMGDFNHDGVFDVLDAVELSSTSLFDRGRYGLSSSSLVAVPEPAVATMAVIAIAGGALRTSIRGRGNCRSRATRTASPHDQSRRPG